MTPGRAGLTVLLLLALCAGGPAALAETPAHAPLAPELDGPAGRRTPIVAAIEKARPAVVSVYAETVSRGGASPFARDPFADEFFRRFFGDLGPTRPSRTSSLGSGVIIDGARGLAATNEHVIGGASKISVILADGREFPARLLGSDPRYDLALLEIQAGRPLPQLPLSDGEDLMIGETVIAIGNPFGLSHTATVGIISAAGREVPLGRQGETLKDLIQTDAAINPGNSGGPLLNVRGEIIGLNTAIIRGDGLGFAIPSNQIRRVVGRLTRGEAGRDLDLGLELAESGRPRRGATGCLIIGLTAGGPADRAGLRKGDLLMKLDGSAVDDLAGYEMILSSLEPGIAVQAEANRDGQALTAALTPRRLSAEEALALARELYGLAVLERPGFLELLSPPAASPAARAGLRAGDRLLALGDRRLASAGDLAAALLENRFKTSLAVAGQRGRTIFRTTLAR